jgi:hypothetical protein
MWESREDGLSDVFLTQLLNSLNENQIRLMATSNFGVADSLNGKIGLLTLKKRPERRKRTKM